jgi:Flp pilus assembly protein TadB
MSPRHPAPPRRLVPAGQGRRRAQRSPRLDPAGEGAPRDPRHRRLGSPDEGGRTGHHLRRLGPTGQGGRRGRRPRRFAVRVGVAAGVLLCVLVAMAAPGLLPKVTVIPGLVPVAVVAAVAWPATAWVAGRRAAARRLAGRTEAAPAVLDLLGAALLAGLNPHKAVLRVAERAPDALRQDLGLAAAVLHLGGTPAAALRAAADRSGLDELRAAAAALEAAERWGAPPAEALAARAEALRSRARLRAEAEAGRAAVRLAFPLVFCFLPAFVLTNVKLRLQSGARRWQPAAPAPRGGRQWLGPRGRR